MNKNIFKKQNIMPVAVLVIICLAVALLMACVNLITAPEIERRKQEAIDAAFKVVLPDGSNFEEITLPENYPDIIDKAYKADGGYVFEITVKGKESMTLMTGVNSEGKLIGIEIISEAETPGFKEKVFPNVIGTSGIYSGKDSLTLAPEIVTGATYTSEAVYNAVKASLDAFAISGGTQAGAPSDPSDPEEPAEVLPKTDEEIKALAATLLGTAADQLVAVTPTERDKVKRVYRDKGGRNYAVYTVVINERYNSVETETLIHISANGTVKGIEKLTWKVSDPMPEYGYNPPAEDVVDDFYQSLVGKDSTTIGDVDLQIGTTSTTTALVGSVTEAITAVKTLSALDMPTPEEEVIALAATLLGVSADDLVDVTPDAVDKVKRVYRDNGGKGYAIYTVVINERYGSVETETLLHIGEDGVIKAIDKMTWKVSDPMPEYGYNPPAEDVVDAFLGEFIDKNRDTVGEVDITIGVTNTATSLLGAITEALEAVELIESLTVEEQRETNAARIVGIVTLSVAVVAFLAYLIIPKVIKRRKI